MNRNSSDRLTQAEALWALFHPRGYPVVAFEEAWRQVLLYSEHSWGALGSCDRSGGRHNPGTVEDQALVRPGG